MAAMTKETGQLSVSTENILPIIKKWLYSEHDIFLRELISNAHDAIHKLKELIMRGEYQGAEPEYKITLIPDKEKKTLTIRDNGLGMDADEIKKYINQIAFSGARDFVSKYEKKDQDHSLIGYFGLGFYSAFMVSHEVEIFTRSFKPESQAVHWKSDGSVQYELEPFEKSEVGTEIVLHILDDSKEFLDDAKLKETVRKYSNFLPVKIFIGEEQVNQGAPLWVKSPGEIKDEEYVNFYKELFPGEFEPLFWIHLQTDFPFQLRGILYFPKLIHELDASKGNIKLFVNNVFVADKIKEVTPEFLSVLMGALDSPDIPLNVSRSQLQGDPRVRKIASHIVKKVGEKLAELFAKDRPKYEEIWAEINTFLKFGAISDEGFFEKLRPALLFKNLDQKWVSLDEYLEKNREKHKGAGDKTLVLYVNEGDDISAFKGMLEKQDLEAVYTYSAIDSHFINLLEQKIPEIRFARVDSDMNEIFYDGVKTLDEKKEQELKDIFKQCLEGVELELEIKNFKEESLPALLTTPEQMRRLEEMSAAMMGKKSFGGFVKDKLALNAKSPVVLKLPLVHSSDPQRAKALVNQIYDVAALAAGKLKGQRLADFVARSFDLLNS